MRGKGAPRLAAAKQVNRDETERLPFCGILKESELRVEALYLRMKDGSDWNGVAQQSYVLCWGQFAHQKLQERLG